MATRTQGYAGPRAQEGRYANSITVKLYLYSRCKKRAVLYAVLDLKLDSSFEKN